MAVFRLPRSWRSPLFLCLGPLIFITLYYRSTTTTPLQSASSLPKPSISKDGKIEGTTAVIVAALQKDDVSWIDVPGFEVWKYEVDNTKAKHKIPKQKGNEAAVYLTHIIDQYDNLTNRLIFMHSSRYQWHNDDPKYDAARNLKQLRLQHVDDEGYVSLRCHWFKGCPTELIFPTIADTSPTLENYYSYAFPSIFPDRKRPDVVSAGCCSQFAITAEAIRRNSKEEYVRIRKWLFETQMPDYMSGRVLEYSWHLLFGKMAVHCPSAEECYCRTYGICGLDCKEEGDCGRYQYPFDLSWYKTLSWKVKHLFG